MLWWFLILGGSAAVILWASIALYLQVRRHMQASHDAVHGPVEGAEIEPKQGAGQS